MADGWDDLNSQIGDHDIEPDANLVITLRSSTIFDMISNNCGFENTYIGKPEDFFKYINIVDHHTMSVPLLIALDSEKVNCLQMMVESYSSFYYRRSHFDTTDEEEQFNRYVIESFEKTNKHGRSAVSRINDIVQKGDPSSALYDSSKRLLSLYERFVDPPEMERSWALTDTSDFSAHLSSVSSSDDDNF